MWMGYLRSVAHSVFATDWSKRRGWSALRRGTVVVISLMVFTSLFGADIGALASVAALYVGLQDRASDPPRYTVRIMLFQTLLLAGVVLWAGLVRTAWFTSLLLVVLAGMSGLTARRDKAVSRVFADVIAVLAFLGLSSVSQRYALEAATAVLGGALLQTITTRAAAGLVTDLPERRPVANALRLVAKHLDDAEGRRLRGTGEAAAAAIRAADDSVGRTDLSHDRRRALRKLIGDAEILREEASSIRARQAFDTAAIADRDVSDAIEVASRTLQVAAGLLASDGTSAAATGRRVRLEAELSECDKAAAEIAGRPDARGSATAIATGARRVIRHVRGLNEASVKRKLKRSRHVRTELTEGVRTRRPRDVRAALRLAVAAAIGLGLADLLSLSHGGWVAATTVALLRPDHRALTSDTVARSVGTAVGAVLVIPLVFLTGDLPGADVILVGVLSVITYVVTSANEGLYIIAITIETVFTRAVVGEDPTAVAIDRVTDVLLGCAIAIVMLLLLPLRHGRRLRYELADYANASAAWISAVAAFGRGEATVKQVRRDHRAMVSARATVQHGLDVRKLEPLGPGMPPWLAHNVYTLIHDADRACGAADATLRHGIEAPPEVVAAAEQSSRNLRDLAAVLYGDNPTSPEQPVPSGPPTPSPETAGWSAEQRDVADLMSIAVRESASALQLAQQSVRPSSRRRTGGP